MKIAYLKQGLQVISLTWHLFNNSVMFTIMLPTRIGWHRLILVCIHELGQESVLLILPVCKFCLEGHMLDNNVGSSRLFDKKIWTIEDVAAFLGKSIKSIYNMTSRGQIPYRKRAGTLYFFSTFQKISLIAILGANGASGDLGRLGQCEFFEIKTNF